MVVYAVDRLYTTTSIRVWCSHYGSMALSHAFAEFNHGDTFSHPGRRDDPRRGLPDMEMKKEGDGGGIRGQGPGKAIGETGYCVDFVLNRGSLGVQTKCE